MHNQTASSTAGHPSSVMAMQYGCKRGRVAIAGWLQGRRHRHLCVCFAAGICACVLNRSSTTYIWLAPFTSLQLHMHLRWESMGGTQASSRCAHNHCTVHTLSIVPGQIASHTDVPSCRQHCHRKASIVTPTLLTRDDQPTPVAPQVARGRCRCPLPSPPSFHVPVIRGPWGPGFQICHLPLASLHCRASAVMPAPSQVCPAWLGALMGSQPGRARLHLAFRLSRACICRQAGQQQPRGVLGVGSVVLGVDIGASDG